MSECIFCKIVNSEIPSFKIWENESFVAILDINPNCKGQTLLLTKKHFDSDLLKMDDQTYANMFLSAKQVSELLKKALRVNRVGLIFEGTGVNHAHLKLYPMHGVGKEFKETINEERVWFDKYAGFLTSKMGLQANFKELEELAEKIRNASK